MPKHTLLIDGPIVPKARARVTRNGTFHPGNYQEWKRNAIFELSRQWAGEPLSGVTVSVTLKGKHSRRGDADNVSGAILDALVQSGILKDDNLTHVRELHVYLDWNKKIPPTTEITICK